MLSDLLSSPGVVEAARLEGVVGVLALHGGLESGTAEAARAIASRCHASLYTVVQPPDLRWHVPSIHFDPRKSTRLRTVLEHVRLAVSVHGFGRKGFEGAVLVGGTNRRVASGVAAAIERRGVGPAIGALDEIPPGLRGLHPANPVNLPEHGGVQLELSVESRLPEALGEIIAAVAGVIAVEQRSLCVAPGT